MRQTWENQLPANLKGKLQEANNAFRQMVPINQAASARGDEVIMPRALQKATARQAGRDVSRMPPDALVDPALKVLPPNLPDSGTAGRLLATDLGTLGWAALMKAPAAAVTSRTGQRLLTGNTPMQTRYAPAYAAAMAAALRDRKKQEENGGLTE